MPKKFVGENSKAVVAKQRKQAAQDEETSKKKKQEEEEYWKDDDKQHVKKQQKKEELERKKAEQLLKKAEAKVALEEEVSKIKIGGKQTIAKVTRAEIEAETEKRAQAALAAARKDKEPQTHVEKPLEENINRVKMDAIEARSVDEALTVLSEKDGEVDQHPERRLKAAYNAYSEERLPQLRAEHPNMRLSQVKQLMWKEWLKSPRNPVNQPKPTA